MSKKKYNVFTYILLILIILSILLSIYLYYSNLNLKNKINIEKNKNNINMINNDLKETEINNIKNKETEINNIKNKYNNLESQFNKNNNLINNIKNKYNDLESQFNKINHELTIKNDDDSNKVCMSIKQFNNIKNNNNYSNNRDDTIIRDYRVLNDELFPPINRSDIDNHTELRNNIINRNMYIKTNNMNDTYRLVAYVTNTSLDKDIGNNSWKLFGRQKDRHSSEFYMSPTNNNNDLKIYITDDIILGDKLRDIYAIPNIITFNSPMLKNSSYQVVEIPRNDFIYNP